MKEDLLDTQFDEENGLADAVDDHVRSIVGKLVMGRDMMSYETLDLFPSVEAYKIHQQSSSGDERGVRWTAWRLIEKENKFHPITIPRGEVWTIVDVYAEGNNVILMKIAGRGGEEVGWTPHFFRLRFADG